MTVTQSAVVRGKVALELRKRHVFMSPIFCCTNFGKQIMFRKFIYTYITEGTIYFNGSYSSVYKLIMFVFSLKIKFYLVETCF